MSPVILERGGALLAVIFVSRVWAKWRTARRERTALTTPLVDRAVLEAVFAPRAKDGDDSNLLAEMRDTFVHLNREAYAEEFYGISTQLTVLYGTLAPIQQATMRRALVRLVTANDRWLQLVGAKACAALGIRDAVSPMRALLEMSGADKRYRTELEQALNTLA